MLKHAAPQQLGFAASPHGSAEVRAAIDTTRSRSDSTQRKTQHPAYPHPPDANHVCVFQTNACPQSLKTVRHQQLQKAHKTSSHPSPRCPRPCRAQENERSTFHKSANWLNKQQNEQQNRVTCTKHRGPEGSPRTTLPRPLSKRNDNHVTEMPIAPSSLDFVTTSLPSTSIDDEAVLALLNCATNLSCGLGAAASFARA